VTDREYAAFAVCIGGGARPSPRRGRQFEVAYFELDADEEYA
jgi:hypothetical protein